MTSARIFGGGLQVGEGLEQRDDIQDRCGGAALGRVRGEAVDRGEVVGGPRERHDVATGGARAELLLDGDDAAEHLEHLMVCSLRGPPASRSASALRVHGRVLAHLEFGEVEAEGLDLPDELLQVPVRLARSRRLRERTWRVRRSARS